MSPLWISTLPTPLNTSSPSNRIRSAQTSVLTAVSGTPPAESGCGGITAWGRPPRTSISASGRCSLACR